MAFKRGQARKERRREQFMRMGFVIQKKFGDSREKL